MSEPTLPENPFNTLAQDLSKQMDERHAYLAPPQTDQVPDQPAGFLPPEEKNPFIDIAKDLAKRNQEDKDLQTKFTATRAIHSEWTPDQAQEALLLSGAHPTVEPAAIASDLNKWSQFTDQRMLEKTMQEHPRLAAWMKDPIHATAIKDDVANLGWFEWLISGHWEHVDGYEPTPQELAYAKANGTDPKYRQLVPNIWQATTRHGMDEQRVVNLSMNDMNGALTPAQKQELQSLRRRSNIDFAGDEAAFPWLRRVMAETVGMGPYMAGSVVARATGAFAGAGAGGLMTAELGPGAAAGATIGGTIGEHIAGQAWDFYQQVGPLYENLLDLKHPDGSPILSPSEARNYALWTTLGTSAITSSFGGVVTKAIPGVRSLMSSVSERGLSQALAQETAMKVLGRAALRYGETVGSMGIIMGAQAGSTAAAEEIARSRHGETGSWARVMDASARGFKQGAESAILMAAWEPSRMLLHDSAKLANMHLDIMRLQALTDAAQNSEVLKKNPQVGEKVLSHLVNDDGSEVTIFYIDPQGFEDIFAKEGVSARQAAAQVFGDTKAFDQAKIDGAPMAIPAEQFIRKLATTKNAKEFLQITKLRSDGITLSEAKVAQSAQQARLKEIDEQISATEINPYKSIEEDFFLTAKSAGVLEDVARAEAKITAQKVKGWVAYYPKDTPENDPYLWYTRIFNGLEIRTEKGPAKIEVGNTKEFHQLQIPDDIIRDESGQPRVFYHGTSSEFDEFRPNYDQLGIHFGTEFQAKNLLDTIGGKTSKIIQTHLRVKNSLRMSDYSGWLDPSYYEDASIPHRQIFDELVKGNVFKSFEYDKFVKMKPEDVVKKIQDAGYDSIVYANTHERPSKESGPEDSYIVFDNKQIHQTGKFPYYESAFEQTKEGRILRGQLLTKDAKLGEPVEALLKVFKSADASTFTHEMTHFWFETMASFAEAPDAPAEMKGDFKTLLTFMGYKDSADRNANINAKAEEKITYAWEKYLSEGKAPVPELAGTFRRFKLWMLKIYGQLGPTAHYQSLYGQELNVSPAVKQVFDKLLGAHDAVENAARQAGSTSLDKLLEYMSPKEQEYYRRSVDALKEEGERQLIQHMHEDEMREAKSWFRDEFKSQLKAARETLAKRPEYKALAILQDGKTPGGRDPGEGLRGIKLDPDTVKDVLGTDDLSVFPRGIWAKGGKSPDEISFMLGFDGGDALLNALRNTAQDGSFAKAAGVRAKARMTARYGAGLLDDPQRLGDAAVDAINNTNQVRKIMLEMRALRKQLDPKSAPLATTISPEALQVSAERILDGKMLKDLDSARYLTAQRFAAIRAGEALGRGDLSKAYSEKEYELLSGFLYKAAQRYKNEAEKVQKSFERMSTDGIRKRLGLAEPLIRDVSDAILESVGQREFERGDAKNISSLAAWEDLARQNNLELPYDEDSLRNIINTNKPLRNMTLDEAKDISNALSSIQFYGRTLQEIKARDARVSLDTAVGEMVLDMEKQLPFLGKAPAARTQTGGWDTVVRRLQAFDGAALEPETLFGWMGDRAKTYIWDRYIDSRNTHDDLARSITGWFHDQWSKLPKSLVDLRYTPISDFDRSLPIPDYVNLAGARDHTTLWMIALNMGNESNKQRMLNGFAWKEEQVMQMLNKHMTKAEWEWVQSIWNLCDKELWPQIASKGERTTGIAPEKIPASTITTPFGEYEGGYFPARYEPRASDAGAQQVGSEVSKTNTTIGRMGTLKSYTKGRVEGYNDIVSLQWSEVPNHISQVIYDLAFDEYVRDMNKVLTNRLMQDTMYQRLGSERSQQINDWLGVVASGAPNGVARGVREISNGILGGLRSRAVLSSIGWSTSVMMSETSHFFTSMASGTVKPSYGAPALAEMMFRYPTMREQAVALSKEVQHRADSVTFQMRQELGEVGEKGPKTKVGKAYQAVRDTAFYFVQHLDNAITTWSFTAAYRQALGEGMKPEDAIRSADAAIRKTLPTHSVAEQSALLREKQTIGSLFMFYGYFNKLYNLTRTIVHDPAMSWIEATTTGEKVGAAGKSAVAAGRVMAMLFLATAGGEFMGGRGREDDETWGQWVARKGLAAPFSIIPIVGTVADQAIGKMITGSRKEVSMRQAPALAWAEDMLKSLGVLANPKKEDDEKAWEALKIVLSTVGLPGSRQFSRTGQYLSSGQAEQDFNRNQFGSLGSGLMYGNRKHQPQTPPLVIQALTQGREP